VIGAVTLFTTVLYMVALKKIVFLVGELSEKEQWS
jgi:hypothetical protein